MAVWRLDRTVKRKMVYLMSVLLVCGTVYAVFLFQPKEIYITQKDTQHVIYDENLKEYLFDKRSPLIFIGGIPRSGTTLMRALLDAHPDIRCGEETRVIPNILMQRSKWMNNPHEKARLLEAGIDDEVLNDAIAAFMLEIMVKHGEPAKRLCNKDPFVLGSISYLRGVFPNGKYLLMIRDGRATVHSIISRHVGISGYNITDYRDCLTKWNRGIEKMYNQCLMEGPSICLPVFYEQLILHPEEWLHRILEFLDVPWNDAVLHHEEAVGKPGGISLSKVERSTDQVIKPINHEALTKWVGHIPMDVQADIDVIAPMLERLGYDPHASYPNYGQFSKDAGGEGRSVLRKRSTNLRELRDHLTNGWLPWRPGVAEARYA